MHPRTTETSFTPGPRRRAGRLPGALPVGLRKRVRALGSLLRPPFVLLVLLFAQLGSEQGGRQVPFARSALLFLTVSAWSLALVAMNELGDEDVDRHNLHRQDRRPLVNGDLSRSEMRLIARAAAALALLTAVPLGAVAVVVVLAGLILGAAYSLPPARLNRRGPVTSLLLPLGYVMVPFLTGAAAAHAPASTPDLAIAAGHSSALLLAGLYLSFLGRLLLKDFRDLEGDMLYGKRTFLVRYGRLTTVATSAVCWITGGVPIVLAAGSAALALAYAVSAVSTLWLLDRLAASVDERADDIIIAAVAALGRSVLLATVCLYAARNSAGPAWLAPALVAGSTVMGLLAQWRYLGSLTAAQRTRLRGAARRDHIRYPTATQPGDPTIEVGL